MGSRDIGIPKYNLDWSRQMVNPLQPFDTSIDSTLKTPSVSIPASSYQGSGPTQASPAGAINAYVPPVATGNFDIFNNANSGVLDNVFNPAATIDSWGRPNTLGGSTQIPEGYAPLAENGINWGELANTKGLGGMVLGGLQTGLAGWQTWNNYQAQKEAAKLGRQEMALMKEDFANNARNTNQRLEDRKAVSLNMKGINLDSPEGKAQMAAYMDKWRVNERPIG